MTRKYINFGGHGGRDSGQMRYIDTQKYFRRRYFNKAGSIKLTNEELDDYLGQDKLECLECGQDFKGLTKHIINSHMTKADYCEKFGIPPNTTLLSKSTIQKISENSAEVAAEQLAQEAVINCPTCGKKYIGTKKKQICGLHYGGTLCEECRKEVNRLHSIESQEKYKYKAKYTCSYCGKSFETENDNLHRKHKRGKPVYCSFNCSSLYGASLRPGYKNPARISEKDDYIKRTCPGCNKEFYPKKGNVKYCSKACYHASPWGMEQALKNGMMGGRKRAQSPRNELGQFNKDNK